MWASKRTGPGFTIVELLIVIVIIAILAAVTMVAFNGVTARANNTQSTEVLSQYIKAYGLYAIDNGDYPQLTGCLGTGYPGSSCLSQNGTSACWGIGAGGISSTGLVNALKPYMNNAVPTVNAQAIACGGSTYIGMYGYYNTTTHEVQVYAFFNGTGSCPSMSLNVRTVAKGAGGNGYLCVYYLSALTS